MSQNVNKVIQFQFPGKSSVFDNWKYSSNYNVKNVHKVFTENPIWKPIIRNKKVNRSDFTENSSDLKILSKILSNHNKKVNIDNFTKNSMKVSLRISGIAKRINPVNLHILATFQFHGI